MSKLLEKRMSYNQVMDFLKEHPKYELSSINDVTTWSSESIDNNLAYAYDGPHIKKPINKLFKLKVCVTYSKCYVNAIKAYKEQLHLLNNIDLVKYLPKI